MRYALTMVRAFFTLAFLLIAACVRVDIEDVQAGRFEGTVHVVWVGEGSDRTGDGLFVYLPQPGDELRFIRPGGEDITIEPYAIYTDGGSIPRVATLFPGLSPWGYAPAYVVHDFLFIARTCAGGDTAREDDLFAEDLQFRDTVIIMAEALNGLIAQNMVRDRDDAPQLVTYAVGSMISRSAWTDGQDCEGRRLALDDPLLAPVLNSISGLRSLSPDPTAAPGVRVATLSFGGDGRPLSPLR